MTMLDVQDLEARAAPAGRTSAGRAIGTVLLAGVMAVLLCADSLVHVADGLALGSRRDAALAVTHPIQDLSHAFGLHLPRQWLAEWTGNADLPTGPPAGNPLDVPSAVAATATTPTTSKSADAIALATTLPPVPTTTTLPPRRVPTVEDPLRVAMMGDSLMGQISAGLGRLVRDDGRVSVIADFHVSTGLARPDRLDWPTYLSQQLPAVRAEVVFLAFGGNDDQDMQAPDGTYLPYLTPEWQAEYARRVALAMDVAVQGDRTVIWLGLPAEEPERLNAAKDVMNAIAREQADLRPRVEFLDVGTVLTPTGVYSDVLVNPDGSTTRVREPDGVHLSVSGGDVLAPWLLSAIATEWNLAPPAAPGPTAPVAVPPP
jgi:hypothetical protein